MDYEKAYKDSLERARQFSEHPLLEDSGNIVEYIFPELKESEDERIKKDLIGFFKDEEFLYHKKEEIVEWLEKQGEQKYTQKDIDDAYLKGIADVKREVEKQDEQTEKMKKEIAEFIFMSKEDIKHRHEWIKCLGYDVKFLEDDKQGEQKPTWNEEDEKIRKNIISYLQVANQTIPQFQMKEWITWLEKQGEHESSASTLTQEEVQKLHDHLEMHKELNDANVRKEFKWDSENKIMTIYGVTYEEMKALDDFIYCLRSGTKCPKGENGEERFTYQYPPTSIGHNEGINTPGKKPIFVDVDDLPDNPVDAFAKGVEKARSEMKSEPQTVTFIDSNERELQYEFDRVIDKLNEIIGKLGDIYEVLSKPYVFPYRDYTPPQEPWYKTHGVEKVPPVTCETLSTMLNVPHVSGTKGKKSPFNSEKENNEE